MFNAVLWCCILAAALCCTLGFKRYAWFLTVGYGLSILLSTLAVAAFALCKGCLNPALYLQAAVLVVYGIRLGIILLVKEKKSQNSRKLAGDFREPKMPVVSILLTWLASAFLYGFQVSALAYRVSNEVPVTSLQWIAFGVSAAGLLLEIVADLQKNRSREDDSRQPLMTGLYRVVRCPNYLGEVILWLGVLLSAIGTVRGIQWIPVIAGWLYINCIMITAVRRSCMRQNKSCADYPGFSEYAARTPVLLPLIPWYITKVK